MSAAPLPRGADPRLRLGVSLATLTLALAVPRATSALLLAAIALGALIIGARGARYGTPWRALLAAWALGAFAGLLRALLTPGPPLCALTVFGWGLSLSREGAARGALALSRVLAATSSAAWLTAGTPFPQLIAALAWMRVPAPLLELLLLAHRSRFALAEALGTVRCAQSMRLGYVGARRSFASAGVLLGAAACRAVDRAAAMGDALQLRGDRGLASLPQMKSRRAADVAVAAGGIAALAASGATSWGWPW
jgi:cobalt/nickel transport system permease protein